MKNDRHDRLVLVVEDNSDDERLTVRALKGRPLRIAVARDGHEAIASLFEGRCLEGMVEPSLPDLVLLDLKLPKVNGIDILRRIRSNEQTRSIPVVVLTSSDEDRDITQCYANGANSYVCKPIDFIEFSDTVKAIADYWLHTNRLAVASANDGTPALK